MSLNLFKIKQKLIAEGQRFAVATIAAESSSLINGAFPVPQIGSKIILTADGQVFGTTGNDTLDEEVMRKLRECLHNREDNSISITQSLKIFIERVEPAPALVIIGASETGLAIAKLAANLDFRIIIVDERADLANKQRFPMADSIVCESDLLKALSLISFDESCYVVIVFQANDDRAVRYCLNKPWAYCGMLGSKNRIGAVWEKLRRDGAPEARLKAVHAPIGFDIGAQSPEEIAIATLAEVLAVKNKGSCIK